MKPTLMNGQFGLALLALALGFAGNGRIAAAPRADDQAAAPQRTADSQITRSLSLASGYHELALLYIKKGEPEKAIIEARRILQLRLPVEHENLVVKSLAIIAEKLGEVRRFDLSQILLDECLKAAEQAPNRVITLKTKARLYRLAGDDDRAIESFRQALDLEGRSIR